MVNRRRPALDDPQRQSCKVCGIRDKFDFHVPDELWEAIVPGELRGRVVCLACFDDFAYERGVPYAGRVSVLYFAGDQTVMELTVTKAVTVNS